MSNLTDNQTSQQSFVKIVKHNLDLYRLYYYDFKRIFKFKLSEVWINNLLGLDVVKLDEMLHVPDGTSCKDYIQTNYGDEGLAVVMAFLRKED